MRSVFLLPFIFAIALTGCAGSVPKATFVQPPKKDAVVDSNDSTIVSVSTSSGVEMLDQEKTRLSQVIAQNINEKKSINSAGSEENAYEVDVNVTRYEKGNAFARAMHAGLGQIHIDARVRLLTGETHEKLSEFDIKKTFAWGGVYGATTRIDDVEPAFAEGIAAALTGTPDNSAQPDSKK